MFECTKNSPGCFVNGEVDPHIWPLQFDVFNSIQFSQAALQYFAQRQLYWPWLKSFNKSFILPDIILLVLIRPLLYIYPQCFFRFVKE
jgi:hypothetical protein